MKSRKLIIFASLCLLILVGAIVGTRYEAQRAKRTRARAEIETMKRALNHFYLSHGYFPSSEMGLKSLFQTGEEKVSEVDPKLFDPWGNAYFYRSTGKAFVLGSFGADGATGGRGVNADIVIGIGEPSHNSDFDVDR
jgi:general secretion pathway protein G